jgi:LPXTG-site transpeptidase (sortase) family protein
MRLRRSQLAATLGAGGLLLLVLFALFARGSDAAPGGATEATEVPAAVVPATPTPDLSATPIPKLAADLQPLYDFVARHGYPREGIVGRIRIPRIGVDAELPERVPADLNLASYNPFGPADVVWYNLKHTTGFGGEPGDDKNAIFSGHTDYNYPVAYAQGARYAGPGVFAGLNQLEVNDGIEITFKGETTRYGVVWVKQVPEDSDWGAVFRSEQPEGDSITLITCTGEFDPATQEYSDRTVVRARRF